MPSEFITGRLRGAAYLRGARGWICALVAAFAMLGAGEAAAQIVTLFDGHGFKWDPDSNGSIYDGHNDAYDAGHLFYGGAGAATLLGPFSTWTTEESGREIVFAPTTIDGVVNVTPKIYSDYSA